MEKVKIPELGTAQWAGLETGRLAKARGWAEGDSREVLLLALVVAREDARASLRSKVHGLRADLDRLEKILRVESPSLNGLGELQQRPAAVEAAVGRFEAADKALRVFLQTFPADQGCVTVTGVTVTLRSGVTASVTVLPVTLRSGVTAIVTSATVTIWLRVTLNGSVTGVPAAGRSAVPLLPGRWYPVRRMRSPCARRMPWSRLMCLPGSWQMRCSLLIRPPRGAGIAGGRLPARSAIRRQGSTRMTFRSAGT